MKEYVVIYEWTGKNYSAYVPDLPGCVAAGDTLEETERLMREAITLYSRSFERIRATGTGANDQAKPIAVPS
jgi:predicted RNase H-like HicB family nuclease